MTGEQIQSAARFLHVPAGLAGEPALWRLPDSEFRVLLALLLHRNGKANDAFPTQDTIGELTGLCSRTVRRATDRLEDAGWISMQRGREGAGRSASAQFVYTFPHLEPDTIVSASSHDEPDTVVSASSHDEPDNRCVEPDKSARRTGQSCVRQTVEQKNIPPARRVRPTEAEAGGGAASGGGGEEPAAPGREGKVQALARAGVRSRAIVTELAGDPDLTLAEVKRHLADAAIEGFGPGLIVERCRGTIEAARRRRDQAEQRDRERAALQADRRLALDALAGTGRLESLVAEAVRAAPPSTSDPWGEAPDPYQHPDLARAVLTAAHNGALPRAVAV